MSRTLTRREAVALLGRMLAAGAAPATLTACSREPSSTPAPVPAAEAPPALAGDFHYLSLREIARLIETKDVSPLALTEAMLERIEAVDPRLSSYVTITAERAMDAARRAEQEVSAGRYRGPMHGIPIAVKDLCYTKGVRTMGGMAAYRDFVPTYDATVVRRLEEAGAILLGKLNLTEGAMAGYHPDFEIPVNPWGDELWAGASSSGSGVATAAGLCFGSIGSDTGGSIRFPSMANGVVGLKPTYGRVSRYGVIPLGESLDHVGPMTRRTADAAVMLQTMAGHDANDPTSLRDSVPDLLAGIERDIAGMRLGYDPLYTAEGTDAGLVAAIEQALDVLRSLGAEVIETRMPEDIQMLGETWFAVCAREAYLAHKEAFATRPDEFGPYFHFFLEFGSRVTEEQYAAASRHRQDFNRRFNAVMDTFDALVCPAGGVTFEVGPEVQYGDEVAVAPLFAAVQMQFTIPADFAGAPALTLPCGASGPGVPYAMQIMGRRLSEPSLCRIGHAYESATEWHELHPPI
jgi:amidase